MSDGLLAVDLGTARVKAGVVGLEGDLIAFADRPYPLIDGGAPGWVEQDAAVWWEAARDSIRTAVAGARGTRVIAACVGGQGPSVVAIDDRGTPLAKALIWMDHRSEPERHRLASRLGRDVSPYSSVPKAMWLRDRRPEAYARTRWLLQAWDYVAFRMTGVAVSSSFRGSPVFPPDLVAAAELDPARFPLEIVMGEIGGALKSDVARDLGLPPGVPVAGGVNDSTATILGTGIVRKGLAIDYGGTSGGLGLAWDAPLSGDGINAWPAPAPALFICGGALAAAGRSFTWLLETFGYGATARPDERRQGEWGEGGAEAALADAARVPAGAEGLVFLPYLAGERSPLWDEHARGVLFGLTGRHGRAHVARSVLEGVAFALRHIADALRAAGGEIAELRVSGGQARGAVWNRIKADAIGAPVAVPRITEGALLGEAMLAAMGAGRVSDPVSAVERFVRIAERIEPDATAAPAYAESYAVYRALYPRLRDLMAREANAR